MKIQKVILWTVLVLCSLPAVAQSLEVSWDKTTVLVFDAPIQSFDRGSRMLLGQREDSALNLLKLKAGSRDLPPTTLHVMTSDGRIHEFQVQYSENPAKTTWDFRKGESSRTELIPVYGLLQTDLDELLESLDNNKARPLKQQYRYDLELELMGIYYRDGLLLFDLRLSNHSAIPFEISGPEFRVVDSRGKNQSTRREQVLAPWLSAVRNPKVAHLGEAGRMLLSFPAFTIANHKKLLIQLSETRGDRELELKVSGRKILEAKTLPMFHTKPTTAYGSGEL